LHSAILAALQPYDLLLLALRQAHLAVAAFESRLMAWDGIVDMPELFVGETNTICRAGEKVASTAGVV